MIFVDASAIIAIMTRETGYRTLIEALDGDPLRITSPIAIFEAVAGLCRKEGLSVEDARANVLDFLALGAIDIASVTADISATALAAFDRYGKGRGHPAQLNMGDCFAYAAAKRSNAALLFTGNDFAATDIAAAKSSPSLSGKME